MVNLHYWILSSLGTVVEGLLHANHFLCFWLILAATASLYSVVTAFIAMIAALFAWIASMAKRPSHLVRYKGSLDVLLGRAYRASTLTPSLPANNNVSIAAFGGDLVIAYRKAETHFASPSATIIVATSRNLEDWTTVWTYTTGSDDLREVLLWEFRGQLYLYFACLAPNKRGFSPRGMHWSSTSDMRVWSDPTAMGRATEITWDVKVREECSGPVAYKVGYIGNHYAADALLTVVFESSTDGETWKAVGKDIGVYVGGISEVSFAFTANEDLVAIGRNEDGDSTGFGSQLFFAPKDDLGCWTPLRISMPYRFDSPRMVLMEGEIVLFARYAREPYNFVPSWCPFGIQRTINLIAYSARPKSAAVYRIRPPEKTGAWPEQPVELIRNFEECYGDTGFFSVAKLAGSSEWAVANYASSCHSHAAWVYGQLFPTDVYVCRCVPMLR
mmetsp:Transcript_93867/g.265574  ORF Transcript_93867/g.265574 Transcript_93867/m.265574 type:complete len:444 (+) Transcript_93867:90-1421(+)|eukprot:CAMPEP_0168364602 /NCGR_PEP_ID=MMETSP0228-20121227/4291_1 /TAXON_ID=133427 /ORGANISM="Protoceratium reticulatum, Strain CCCM 535 (=CCMP 1889)" /LENGTH=443 /DNA_ID=CAMNT_0008377365 /DNA_START=86 /DNA_END=1417 /DNA_ORIENTATION=-